MGGKSPNAWGLHDMAGNVFEWTWDWYASTHASGTVTDYAGPASGMTRVYRGGSWYDQPFKARAAYRFSGGDPGRNDAFVGFRLARSAR